ncbi:DUF4352 domain-containing protein [Streptomyces sp. JUS-F4]|uniref:DUF4352 domain-containing protein n=1 Tax=Streptomyces TaxID=1883 RepID=UPI0018749D45|nr:MULTISPECIES: DUF4352 domain-containing protein [Streptomyces]MDX2670978.1 DUF4352 domain-containing protein [Streptomyces sp. NRRL_ISP-5395]WKN13444.1 DUF4352 domain-containing protein [Streptomyces sp. JUS-F4]GHF77981.1 hypothetical protein GCM10010504_53610 [Streptomyces griseus]
MSNQQPQPGQPQQPGWGQQPPPAQKRKTGKIVGFGCLGIVGLIVLIAVIATVASGGDDGNESSTTKPAASQGETKKDEPKEEKKEEESAEKAPVTVTAKAIAFEKSVLAQGDDYTSVQVTITNNSKNDIDVNPLYVTITGTDGSKHTAELGVAENQLDAVKLAPGENVTGTVTGKGTFDAKYVTYTDGLLGDSVRGDVS